MCVKDKNMRPTIIMVDFITEIEKTIEYSELKIGCDEHRSTTAASEHSKQQDMQ